MAASEYSTKDLCLYGCHFILKEDYTAESDFAVKSKNIERNYEDEISIQR